MCKIHIKVVNEGSASIVNSLTEFFKELTTELRTEKNGKWNMDGWTPSVQFNCILSEYYQLKENVKRTEN